MKIIPRLTEVYAEPYVKKSSVVVVGSHDKETAHKGILKIVRVGPDVDPERTKVGQLIMIPARSFVMLARGVLVTEKYIICDVEDSEEFDEMRPEKEVMMKPITAEEAGIVLDDPTRTVN